jgi:cytochrome c
VADAESPLAPYRIRESAPDSDSEGLIFIKAASGRHMKTEISVAGRRVDGEAQPRCAIRMADHGVFYNPEGIMPMKYPLLTSALLGLAATLASSSVLAQAKVDVGKREYDFNCIGCHGPTGAGDGPYARYLTVKVPALNTLARRNHGVFPVSRVHEIIDGRREVKGHGPRNMPVWGADYLGQAKAAAPEGMDAPHDPEGYVRGRIAALVDYIKRLQVK